MESPDLEVFENVELRIAVVKAFDELMKSVHIDRISVSEICKVAGISRATFYRHFKDKYSVVQWFIKFIHSQGTNKIGRTLTWYEGYYISELAVARNREFFSNAAKSNDHNSIDNFIPRYRREILTTTLVDYHGVKMTERHRFIVRAAIEMEIHMFPTWHYGNLNCSLEEVCRWLTECIPHDLFALLDTPAMPHEDAPETAGTMRIPPSANFANARAPQHPSPWQR